MSDVRPEPMTAEQYPAYREYVEPNSARSIAESGAMPAQDTARKSAADVARRLPEGLVTSDRFLWTAYDGDTAIRMRRVP
jgi:hypothetical protein